MINRVAKMCVAAMLLTRKRQHTADSDSNSLLGVLLLVCHKAK
jgi:hypothetical protein